MSQKLAPLLPEHFATVDLENHPAAKFDAEGVPLMKVWTTGEYNYNPTFIAGWGLTSDVRYAKSKSPIDYERVIKMADWLVQHQSSNGGFPLNFDHFHPDPRAYKLKSPWYSAVSQGLGTSLLIRAFQKTGDERYLDAATHALSLFTLETTKGGLKGEQNGLPWYEETPDPKDPNHILNGHIFALLGIHDAYLATGNQQARMLWEAGEKSLRKNLREYFVHSAPEDPTLPMPWSVYDLQHKHISMRPNYLTNMYMRIHVRLIRDMAKRTNYAGYEEVASQWEPSLIEYERTH